MLTDPHRYVEDDEDEDFDEEDEESEDAEGEGEGEEDEEGNEENAVPGKPQPAGHCPALNPSTPEPRPLDLSVPSPKLAPVEQVN